RPWRPRPDIGYSAAMRRRALLASLLTAALVAQAAPGQPAELPAIGEPAALPKGAPPHLARIDRLDLRRHAYWLADDARQGRYTGSAGQQATVDYIVAHFKKLGLKPLGDKRSYVQTYPLSRTIIGSGTALTFGEREIATGFALLPAKDADDKVTVSGKFVWCGNGTGDDVTAGLAGRIPLVLLHGLRPGGGPGNDLQAVHRYEAIAKQLAHNGAGAAVVCLLEDASSMANTLTYKAMLSDHPRLQNRRGQGGAVVSIPLLVLPRELCLPLLEHVGITLDQDGAPVTPPTKQDAAGKLTICVEHDDKGTGSNVVAMLPGRSKKKEAVVISAHHDHIGFRLDGDAFNGADDNASGTAGLLEIAEAFAKGGKRPARSIIFLSVSGEELGMWGSAWFADHSPWPLEDLVADVNIDMIGRAGGIDDRIDLQVTPSHGHEKYSTIVRDGVALGAKFGIAFTSGDTYYRRSDHFSFAQKGIPVVFFCDGEHPDYHQVSDHPDKLDYAHMEAIARLAFWTGWLVAEAKGRPQELGARSDW
ncbi:MAG: M20/M25/M40 family metallo-hydrolase, partial [Planctomycetes bacterium]|nr:M20/M25/M40 family metallo-hydrolase [Planctomycetota bacterium]